MHVTEVVLRGACDNSRKHEIRFWIICTEIGALSGNSARFVRGGMVRWWCSTSIHDIGAATIITDRSGLVTACIQKLV